LSLIGVAPADLSVIRKDGDRLVSGEIIVQIHSQLQSLLSAERTMLNFLTHLSGIATQTKLWSDMLKGTGCRVRDTRKTTPGLRTLEKYAVRCGGGMNHRMGLGDAALIKDNHVIAVGGIKEAIEAVRRTAPNIPLEVECDNLSQVKEALTCSVALILLDNMTIKDLRASVKAGTRYPTTKFEASGGLTLANGRAVAETGVDYIAVGALTHSAPALDIALDVEALL
jgi:nicotinate-nucleotide pyrophosphorylase (carboxylating)